MDLPAELNRLAGTTGLDAAGAANALAGTDDLELVGALNVAAGTTGRELNGALHALTGNTLDSNGALVGFEEEEDVPDPQAGRTKFPPDDSALFPTHPTYGDDFLGTSLDAAWTATSTTPAFKYSMPGVRLPFNAQGDHIRRACPNTDMEIVAGFQVFGDNKDAALGQGSMTGLFIVNSSGNGVGCSHYNDGTLFTWNLTGYNYASSGNSLAAQNVTTSRFWLSLRRTGNNFQARWSQDGVTWSSFTANLSNVITAAYIGVGRFFTSGDASAVVELSRFNFYGPTFFTP